MIYVSNYTLVPVDPAKRKREGALLKIEFEDGSIGFADCHPWPELGDEPLAEQLGLLCENKYTQLTEKSFFFARLDAQARKNSESLWKGLVVPQSHHLIWNAKEITAKKLEDLSEGGYRYLKVKVGSDFVESAKALNVLKNQNMEMKFRIDLNSGLNESSLDLFLDGLGSFIDRLDFIEDPIPYEQESWFKIQKKWGIRLALDRWESGVEPVPETFSVFIHKPAIQNTDAVMRVVRQCQVSCVVTSYLDHPLGQLAAAWTCARLSQDPSTHDLMADVHGLLSHHAYSFHSFTSFLSEEKCRLIPPSGAGCGMGKALNDLDWRVLCLTGVHLRTRSY